MRTDRRRLVSILLGLAATSGTFVRLSGTINTRGRRKKDLPRPRVDHRLEMKEGRAADAMNVAERHARDSATLR
jgi:hypothetical protein